MQEWNFWRADGIKIKQRWSIYINFEFKQITKINSKNHGYELIIKNIKLFDYEKKNKNYHGKAWIRWT